MSLNELLEKLKFKPFDDEAERKAEMEKIANSAATVNDYFATLVEAENWEGNTKELRTTVYDALGNLRNYIERENKDKKPPVKIAAYGFTVGSGEFECKLTAADTLKTLVEHFGEPEKQKTEVVFNRGRGPEVDWAENFVFKELEVVQEYLQGTDHWLGRYGSVIMAGQLAFRKVEGDMVQLAVYKPFEDTIGDLASVALYEYDKKDFEEELQKRGSDDKIR